MYLYQCISLYVIIMYILYIGDSSSVTETGKIVEYRKGIDCV